MLICLYIISCGSGEVGPQLDEAAGGYSTFSFSPGTEVKVCNFSDLPFRKTPSPSAQLIRYLPEGTRGVVQGRLYNWYNLAIEGTLGWAYGTALCKVQGEAQPPQPPAPGQPDVRFISPTDGATVKNGVQLKVSAPAGAKRVEYWADHKYLFAVSDNPGSGFSHHKTFDQTGKRAITAKAFDGAGDWLGQKTITVNVMHHQAPQPGNLIQKLPYFYQYANKYYPGSSCQNTSLAMVLKHYGWNGRPDDITAAFGKYKAQSPAGLASVFNFYAQKLGSARRLRAHTNGRLSDVHALLKQGKPVIVHGYFTGSGHVVVITGYDGAHYTVNDPAGRWNQAFKGGYSGGSTSGHRVRYGAAAFNKAIESTNGTNKVPLWYHEVR